MLQIAILAISFAVGFCLVSYTSFAQKNGLLIGTWFRNETSVPSMLGFALCVFTVAHGLFYLQPWWHGVLSIPAGLLIAFAMLRLLRHVTPTLCLLLLPTAFAVQLSVL